MSFPRYERYKDSGVEWLGEVPEHWQVRRLRYSARLLTAKATDQTNPLALENIESWTGRLLPSDTKFEGDGTSFRAGDLLFGKLRPYLAKAYLAQSEGEAVGDFHVMRPSPSVSGRFLFHQIVNRDSIDLIDGSTFGSKMPRVGWDFMSNFVLATPPIAEQTRIVDFITQETAKIDGLIEEQRRLIELLKEKRQAVISHAVTKGLNPDVPMKDSGIEWIGSIPARWTVLPLKRYLDFLTSGSRGWAEHYSDSGALFIRIGNLTRENIHLDLSDIQRVVIPDGAEGLRTKVETGDVLFSITAFLGSVAVVPAGFEDAYVSQHVALARIVGAKLDPSWVAYTTLSVVGKTYLDMQGYGGTKIQLGLDDIANLIQVVPPIEEQRSIIRWLDSELSKYESLRDQAERGIYILQERRSALISAAVTGKIDVRNYTPKEAA